MERLLPQPHREFTLGEYPGTTLRPAVQPPIDPLLRQMWRDRRLERGLSLDDAADHNDTTPVTNHGRRAGLGVVAAVICALAVTHAALAEEPVATPAAPSAADGASPGADAAPASPTADELSVSEFEPTLEPRLDFVDDEAPAQVVDLLERHDGSAASRWAPTECVWLLPLLAEHNLPEWMASVAWRESRCVPTAYNGNRSTRDDSYGLFQINALGPVLREELATTCGITDARTLFDSETSARCAGALYSRYGYQPWHAGKYFA
jgi:hypothetical protein